MTKIPPLFFLLSIFIYFLLPGCHLPELGYDGNNPADVEERSANKKNNGKRNTSSIARVKQGHGYQHNDMGKKAYSTRFKKTLSTLKIVLNDKIKEIIDRENTVGALIKVQEEFKKVFGKDSDVKDTPYFYDNMGEYTRFDNIIYRAYTDIECLKSYPQFAVRTCSEISKYLKKGREEGFILEWNSLIEKLNIESPYATLGITIDATDKDVEKAYRKLALVYHPDKPTRDAKKFEKIKNAKESILSERHPEKYSKEKSK